MKRFHFAAQIALATLCLGLTACDSKAEKYAGEIADLQTEAAELLLDCKDQSDIDDAAKELAELARKAEEVTKNAKSDKLKIEEEAKTMTRRKTEEIEKEISVSMGKASALLQDGIYHARNIKDAKCDELNKSIESFTKAIIVIGD